MGIGLKWRLIAAILEIFPLVLVSSMIFVPESPYHLVKKGKNENVESILNLSQPSFRYYNS